jgi:hypothetical protein
VSNGRVTALQSANGVVIKARGPAICPEFTLMTISMQWLSRHIPRWVTGGHFTTFELSGPITDMPIGSDFERTSNSLAGCQLTFPRAVEVALPRSIVNGETRHS